MESSSKKGIFFRFAASGNRLAWIMLLGCISLAGHTQDRTVFSSWSGNTALLEPVGKWESGIFQPFRYGLNRKMELRAAAFLFPVLPNAGIKLSHRKKGSFDIATEHDLSYPTLFLNIASAKGTGGLISPQFSFAPIISVTNALVVSRPLSQSSVLAADLGLAFSIRGDKPDYQSTIDMPLVYPRMAHYYEGISIRAGVTYKGTLASNLFFEENARLFLITRDSENIFAENYGTVMWAAGKSFRLKFGYVLSWGKYPYGNQTQLWPVIDFVFGSKIR